MSGKLIGVGLGPGAPDLITMRAVNMIRDAQIIAYPALAGASSFARAIAAEYIRQDAREIVMDIPMTTARQPAQDAYDKAAKAIAVELDQNRDVVCLCEGDPLFYGSFMYLQARLKDRFTVEIVPGVTSITSCASSAGIPVAARNQCLTVIPGPLPETELQRQIENAHSVAIMKVGRHLSKIRSVIIQLGMLDNAVYIERATLPNERVMPLADAPIDAPYFSMILLTKGNDPWL